MDMKKYAPAGAEEINAALDTAARLVTEDVEEFFDTFPCSSSVNNFYGTSENKDWTEGFWTGEVWLAYERTGNPRLKEAALAQAEKLLDRIEKHSSVDHHDMGFLYSPSCVAAYKLTGSETGKKAAVLAAENLYNRFQEKGNFFQAWGEMGAPDNYRLIIDCLMNMPLLFWASEVTGDDKYKKRAETHIKTAMKCVVRPDNSTYHTYYFNPETGEPTEGVTCQGNRNGSAWARGQAWGVYGSAIAYAKLKDEAYIDIFRRVTDYFLDHLPEDLVPYWDFDFTTGSDEPRDSSAAAIAVCGMLEMAKYLEKDEAEHYTQAALRLIKALIDKCAVKSVEESNGIMLHSTYCRSTPTNTCPQNGVDECNAWGDYFYMEALTRLTKDWKLYW
ncbi:MAG: glycoside hydrolase family 88 protein [Clostridia bacterium]|nr:glycoside hydrolase family 88 protein [Clostridia bacterium]